MEKGSSMTLPDVIICFGIMIFFGIMVDKFMTFRRL